MGLDYLNKKTWHTASIKNIAKVWEREQKEVRKYQRQDEYNKKLVEEQHAHELKIAQVEAGLIPRSALDKMEWMYNPVLGQQQQQQQESDKYLLGKPVDLKETQNPLQDPLDNSNKYQAIVTEDVTNKTCESFALIHEDPLFKIMQEELRMKEKLLNNPLDMVTLLSEQINSIKQQKSKNEAKKKEKRKEKKEKKREKKEKKEKKQKKEKERSKKERGRSSDHEEELKQNRKSNGEKKRRDRSESQSRERERSKRDRSRKSISSERQRQKKHSRRHHSSSSSSSSASSHDSRRASLREKKRSRSRSESEESKMKKRMYEEYLMKKVGSILVRQEDGSLKPDFGLMKRKFRNNLRPEEKLKMSDVEKKQMIEEMQSNAKNVAAERLKEFADDYTQDEKSIKDLHGKQINPKFLNTINKEIYSGTKDSSALSAQMAKNTRNYQRNIEEKNTFTRQ